MHFHVSSNLATFCTSIELAYSETPKLDMLTTVARDSWKSQTETRGKCFCSAIKCIQMVNTMVDHTILQCIYALPVTSAGE